MSLTNRDPNQIIQFEHDEANNAQRVVVVGQDIKMDNSKIAESLEKALSNIKVNLQSSVEQKEQQIIEKHVFIPQIEIQTVEVPVIVKEIEYREIQVPVIVEKIVRVEVPVIVKEYINISNNETSNPFNMKMGTIIRDVCMLGLMIYHLFSHLK